MPGIDLRSFTLHPVTLQKELRACILSFYVDFLQRFRAVCWERGVEPSDYRHPLHKLWFLDWMRDFSYQVIVGRVRAIVNSEPRPPFALGCFVIERSLSQTSVPDLCM